LQSEIGNWRVGRVKDKLQRADGAFVYELRFPNAQELDVHEDKIFVRCLDAFADPSEILAARCAETQFYADRRRLALRRLRNLRSAAQGITGLLSANIELIPYQAAAVKRVLQDQSLRYLLADEVGLGKTIEAGVIIRQVLIDDPRRRVAVIVPDLIVKQWRAELDRAFSLADFPDSVRVVPHEAVQSIDLKTPPDLVVIDEAHHLIAPLGMTEDHLSHAVAKLANAVPRLLLLSATPPFGEEDRLLGLLNLLDPANHPLNDREGFRRKVEERQTIGRLLLPMKVGGTPFVLRQQAQQAARMFPTDKVVQEEVARVLASGEDRTSLDAAIESLRDHIVRTYRIHQRLIRTRRSDVQKWVMRPRGPQYPIFRHVRLAFDEDPRLRDLLVVLESWRQAAQSIQIEAREAAVSRWFRLLELSSQGFASLTRGISEMKDLFSGERVHLNEILEIARRDSDANRYETAVKTLLDWRRANSTVSLNRVPAKIICFASDGEDAHKLYERLGQSIGLGNVAAESAPVRMQYFCDVGDTGVLRMIGL
jgi:ATP-dependent helicase HepA